MYASVELAAGERRAVVSVPLSAVLDSGTRQVVLVQAAEGRFEPREVKLGTRRMNTWKCSRVSKRAKRWSSARIS